MVKLELRNIPDSILPICKCLQILSSPITVTIENKDITKASFIDGSSIEIHLEHSYTEFTKGAYSIYVEAKTPDEACAIAKKIKKEFNLLKQQFPEIKITINKC